MGGLENQTNHADWKQVMQCLSTYANPVQHSAHLNGLKEIVECSYPICASVNKIISQYLCHQPHQRRCFLASVSERIPNESANTAKLDLNEFPVCPVANNISSNISKTNSRCNFLGLKCMNHNKIYLIPVQLSLSILS